MRPGAPAASQADQAGARERACTMSTRSRADQRLPAAPRCARSPAGCCVSSGSVKCRPPARSTAATSRPPALATSAHAAGLGDRLGDLDGAALDPAGAQRGQHLQHDRLRGSCGDGRLDTGCMTPRELDHREPAIARHPRCPPERRQPMPCRTQRRTTTGRLDRGDGVELAWARRPGEAPTVVFLPGYRSDMAGEKATVLAAYCAARGQAMLRFDYSGHGASGGAVRGRNDRPVGRGRAGGRSRR